MVGDDADGTAVEAGEPEAHDDVAEVAWFPLDDLPELAWEHEAEVLRRLAERGFRGSSEPQRA